MITRETPLRDIFYPQGTGMPNPVFMQAVPKTRLSAILPNFAGEMLDAVHKDIQTSTDNMLKMTPLDILVGGWKGFQEVAKTLDDSKRKPDDPILKPLVKHTVKSVHHPFIELSMDEAAIWKVEFEITASLEVEGATLKIQNGHITHILSGSGLGKFQLSYSGTLLTEAKTGKFNLPGEVRLRPEIAQPLEAVKPQEMPASQASLNGLRGEMAGQLFPLTDGLVIGRSSSCSIRLSDSTVSRRHARLRNDGNEWFIQDMNSSVGIFVNGQDVKATALQNGDIIRIGKSEFEFREQ